MSARPTPGFFCDNLEKDRMNVSYNVFAGAFADEIGQRFLRIMQDACDSGFEDLYVHSMPQNPTRYRGCLDRVSKWDMGVVRDELRRLKQKYPDMQDVFKSTFIGYAKAMRGSRTTKLTINLPKLESFLHAYCVHFSKSKSVCNSHYFETSSVLEKRLVCMDCLRDCLFDHIGDEFVKSEEREVEADSVQRATSVVASSFIREDSAAYRGEPILAQYPNPPSVLSVESEKRRDLDDAETRVVSNVFEGSVVSNGVRDTEPSGLPASVNDISDNISIGPDDSVSCADFADKQHEELNKLRRRARDIESIPEEDQASRTSMSLSSVSITQNGPVAKKPPTRAPSNASSISHTSSRMKGMTAPTRANHDAPFDEDSASDASRASRQHETLSEASMARANKRSGKMKSPPKSYITSLEDSD